MSDTNEHENEQEETRIVPIFTPVESGVTMGMPDDGDDEESLEQFAGYSPFPGETLALPAPQNRYKQLYDEWVATHDPRTLEPMTVADALRTAFFSALRIVQQPSVMMGLMVGQVEFAKGLAAFWTDQFLTKSYQMEPGARLTVIGYDNDPESKERIDMDAVTIEQAIAYGLDHFAAILNKEE